MPPEVTGMSDILVPRYDPSLGLSFEAAHYKHLYQAENPFSPLDTTDQGIQTLAASYRSAYQRSRS